MLLPSEWLLGIRADALYREAKLLRLHECGIGYADGMLTSHIQVGHPYPTYGRLSEVPLMTPREAIAKYGARLKSDSRSEDLMVIGFEVGTAVWRLVRDITDTAPPSKWVDDWDEKLQRDIAAIKGYGY